MEDDDFIMICGALQFQQAVEVVVADAVSSESNIDCRLYPRAEKTKCDHERAACCIRSDYLGNVPRFDGKEFQSMFRVSRSRFRRH